MKVRRGSGRLAGFREWVDSFTGVAVILALALFAATIWAYQQIVAGGTDSPVAVTRDYRAIVGGFPPSDFRPALSGHFVGRRLILMEHDNGLLLGAYTQEWPARALTMPELETIVDSALEFLFDGQWVEVRRGIVAQGDAAVTGRLLRLGDEGGPHLYLLPVQTANGQPVMVALMGPQKEAREAAREIVERF